MMGCDDVFDEDRQECLERQHQDGCIDCLCEEWLKQQQQASFEGDQGVVIDL